VVTPEPVTLSFELDRKERAWCHRREAKPWARLAAVPVVVASALAAASRTQLGVGLAVGALVVFAWVLLGMVRPGRGTPTTWVLAEDRVVLVRSTAEVRYRRGSVTEVVTTRLGVAFQASGTVMLIPTRALVGRSDPATVVGLLERFGRPDAMVTGDD